MAWLKSARASAVRFRSDSTRSAIVVGLGVIGFERDGAAIAGQRLVEAVQAGQRDAAIVVDIGHGRA